MNCHKDYMLVADAVRWCKTCGAFSPDQGESWVLPKNRAIILAEESKIDALRAELAEMSETTLSNMRGAIDILALWIKAELDIRTSLDNIRRAIDAASGPHMTSAAVARMTIGELLKMAVSNSITIDVKYVGTPASVPF